MRPYRFRLASVARIRAIEERVARERFVVALRDLRFSQNKEAAAKAALVEMRPLAGVAAPADHEWHRDQAERLSLSIELCHQKVVEAEEKYRESKQRWTEASKRSGVLAKLDEHEKVRWREDMTSEEAAELDDVTGSRYAVGAVR